MQLDCLVSATPHCCLLILFEVLLSLYPPSSTSQRHGQCVLEIIGSGCDDCSSDVGWCIPLPTDLRCLHPSIVSIGDPMLLCFRFRVGFLEEKSWHDHSSLERHTLQCRCVCICLKHSSKLADKRLSSPARWDFEQVSLPVDYLLVAVLNSPSKCSTFDCSPSKGRGLHGDE